MKGPSYIAESLFAKSQYKDFTSQKYRAFWGKRPSRDSIFLRLFYFLSNTQLGFGLQGLGIRVQGWKLLFLMLLPLLRNMQLAYDRYRALLRGRYRALLQNGDAPQKSPVSPYIQIYCSYRREIYDSLAERTLLKKALYHQCKRDLYCKKKRSTKVPGFSIYLDIQFVYKGDTGLLCGERPILRKTGLFCGDSHILRKKRSTKENYISTHIDIWLFYTRTTRLFGGEKSARSTCFLRSSIFLAMRLCVHGRYICIYRNVYICTYIYICINSHVCIHIHIHVFVYMYVCT